MPFSDDLSVLPSPIDRLQKFLINFVIVFLVVLVTAKASDLWSTQLSMLGEINMLIFLIYLTCRLTLKSPLMPTV